MEKDERDLIDVLKFELEFLDKGGYGRSPREPWRFQFIFEDSPTCMNYDSKESPAPCSDCVLMQLVPPEARHKVIPCRHIPLNAQGETLDSMYQYADQHEIEDAYGTWLRKTIAKLEEQRSAFRGTDLIPSPMGVGETVGECLSQNLHPKCANPACATAFHWLGGGKFLRFRPEGRELGSQGESAQSQPAVRQLKHYWLCERCSRQFTLAYDEAQGVVVRLLWPELMVAATPKELPPGSVREHEV